MKGIKQVVRAITNAELQNIGNEDYAKDIDNYCIVTNIGFFWGKMPKDKVDFTKSKVEKIST